MKFLKTFLLFILFFMAIVSTVAWSTYYSKAKYNYLAEQQENVGSAIEINVTQDDDIDYDNIPLDELFSVSTRVNFLMVGKAGELTDTNMFISYDPSEMYLDIISIPRDTYMGISGFGGAEQRFNAFYHSVGIDQVVKNAEMLIGVDIHYYIEVDYEAVEHIVDAVEGVYIDVPERMRYSAPGLYIDLQKGPQTLSGIQSLMFLRYRATYREGDIDRIAMQQYFVRELVKKIISTPSSLGTVLSVVKENVVTNIPSKDFQALSSNVYNMNVDNISTNTLPGEGQYIGDISFYIANAEETSVLVEKIYRNKSPDLKVE